MGMTSLLWDVGEKKMKQRVCGAVHEGVLPGGARGASADSELCVGMLTNAAVRSGVAREACLVAPVP